MKKTLIALAVLGAFGAAQASDVTIYGKLNPSYDFMKVKDASASGDIKTVDMSDNSSRIGFKGSEDLGGGLKAIFQMEAYFNIVDKSGFGGARDSFAGLQGNWGTFRIGAYDPVYKRITAKYDPFGDSISDYNSIMGMTGGTLNVDDESEFDLNSRYSKVFGYISPKMSGFQVMADVSWTKSDDDANVSKAQSKKLDIGATYDLGPLNVLAAYTIQKEDQTSGVAIEDIKGFKVGAGYVLPTKTKVSAIYEMVKQDGYTDTKHVFLGVQHPINNIDLLANFIWADDNDELGADTGAKAYNLGARYNFSKRTNVLAMYTLLNNDDNGTYYVDGYGSQGAQAGAEISGFSVRLQHNF